MKLATEYDRLIALGTLSADAAQQAVLPLFDRVLHEIETAQGKKRFMGLFGRDEVPVKGLYLWGGVGRGKSMLMDLFFDIADEPRKRRVHFHAFMQEVHAGMHAARQKGVEDAIAPVAADVAEDVRLLCFDEMQISDITDAMIVGRLFQKLFAAGVVIVTTSNRPPDDLYKDGLNRDLFLPFIALIKDRLEVHELTSQTDYRQDKLAGAQTYFHPADAQAEKAISEIWQDLGAGLGAPLTLRVKARDVVLAEFHNGAARVSFHDLCGVPLGAADYLAVAEAVRVLIIENIPLLSRANANEAKRFVTLIDALYEAKVRVIISAADVPEKLYETGDGAFEFERTASRLREMQSAEWGSDRV
jgi:cell division protein ZapE